MADFPHLKLINKVTGTPKSGKAIKGKNARTQEHLNNRAQHANNLRNTSGLIANAWFAGLEARKQKGLPDLSNPETIPLYLQIDPDLFDAEFLRGFGIEIISEEEEGYIIGASTDAFKSLREKIDQFANNNKAINTSNLWQIVDGTIWRRDIILSKELSDRWDQISDNDTFLLEIGVSCYVKLSDEPIKEEAETQKNFDKRLKKWNDKPAAEKAKSKIPVKREVETEEHFAKRHSTWVEKRQAHELEVDALIDERTGLLKDFTKAYNGELIMDEFITFPDSFCCRVKINGIGLKDLVNRFQYLFEVAEADEINVSSGNDNNNEVVEATIIEPDGDSPQICVIDSGILEGHKLLSAAIVTAKSKSYVPGDNSVIDAVGGGGHGTGVAGATLYSANIPKAGDIVKLPFFLLNARILNGNNELAKDLYPPSLMEQILDDFHDSKVFNLSVTSLRPCKTTHMSQWASTIDKLMFERKILFVVATGNIRDGLGHVTNPGVNQHLINGHNYPDYLYGKASRIANPAQSCFALTVGSVCHAEYDDPDKNSFGKYGEPSAFTRSGLGLWGMIKPDVVEFGGDYVVEKLGARNITIHPDVSPELVKTGNNAFGKDHVGTSYATPKVSHIAGILQKEFPQEDALMYRALIVQSARLPNNIFQTPTLNAIKTLGYGIPDVHRATNNTKDRITFITNGNIAPRQAHIYKINIPDNVKRPGDDYDILLEVTLSYFANPRRTRRLTRSYLSATADWESSKLGESQDVFKDRIIKDIDNEGKQKADGGNGINWKIKNRIDTGVEGIRRQDGSLQKDWAIVKSNQLPEEFCIAVIGRKGWETKTSIEIPYAVTISFEVLNAENNIELYQSVQAVNIPVEVQQELEIPVNLI